MYYLLTASGGLLAGLAVAIWMFVERSKRADLEQAVVVARSAKDKIERDWREALKLIGELREENARLTEAATACQFNLDRLRTKLENVNDVEFVKTSLDELLGKGKTP